MKQALKGTKALRNLIPTHSQRDTSRIPSRSNTFSGTSDVKRDDAVGKFERTTIIS